jgi:RNA polymerase sigma-70 factor (ECF subfamily)
LCNYPGDNPDMKNSQFPTTRFTLVVHAREQISPESQVALEKLCEGYWYPLYAFVRRKGYGPDEAQDLTQGFFTRLLERQYLRDYQRERGRFRTFLLGSVQHFLSNERDWARAEKRGGGCVPLCLDEVFQTGEHRYSLEPRSDLTPEKIFEKHWASTLLERTLNRLQADASQAGTGGQFIRLKGYLTGEESEIPYSQVAENLGTTEGALKVSIHRLRRRFREVLHEEISHTVSHPDQIRDEIRFLTAVVSQ